MVSGVSLYGGFDQGLVDFPFRRSATATTTVSAEGTVCKSDLTTTPNDVLANILQLVLRACPASLPALALTCRRWLSVVSELDCPHGNLQIYAGNGTSEILGSTKHSHGYVQADRALSPHRNTDVN